jgi:hypothetical protein
MKHGKGQAFVSTRHPDITGFSPWQRITDARRYRQILSNFVDFARSWRRKGRHAAVSRLFHLYWGVFNGGKQLGCILQCTRIILSNRGR